MKRILLDSSQKKLLKIIKNNSYKAFSTEEIMSYIDVTYPQAINNKLKQLENKWYVRRDSNWDYIALDEPVEEIFYFPLIGFAQCWNLTTNEIYDINYLDTFPFPTKELDIKSNEDLKNYFFTKAKWESMLPLIKENDLVLVKIQKDRVSPWYNTLVIHNWKPKIKRVFFDSEKGIYTLISINPQFPEMEISKPDDELDVIWVVKKVISSH